MNHLQCTYKSCFKGLPLWSDCYSVTLNSRIFEAVLAVYIVVIIMFYGYVV